MWMIIIPNYMFVSSIIKLKLRSQLKFFLGGLNHFDQALLTPPVLGTNVNHPVTASYKKS